jgi:N-glycosylase/DNA lyase
MQKEIIVIYQLKGKASMWWDQLVQVQHIKEKNVTWKEFKKYFENKYLTKRYYDKKMMDFFELNLGSMTITLMREKTQQKLP